VRRRAEPVPPAAERRTRAPTRPSTSESGLAASLLRLQTAAGNAAVVRMIDDRDTIRRVPFKSWRDGMEGTTIDFDLIAPLAEQLEAWSNAWEQRAPTEKFKLERRQKLDIWVGGLPNRFFEEPAPTDLEGWKALVNVEMLRIESEEFQEAVPQDLEGINGRIIANLQQEDVPLEDRVAVECTMGQGLTGDLGKYLFYSDRFSTCSPVLMFNATTRMGGLFHFAANGRDQLTQIQLMHQQINPTWVGVNLRVFGDCQPNEPIDNESDVNALEQLLKVELDTPTERIPSSNTFWLYFDGGIRYSTSGPRTYDKRLNVTGMRDWPGQLSGDPNLRFFFNQNHYKESFAKLV
jgi:hypothetical protein